MQVQMDPGRTIYAAIDALLSLVAPEKAILASVEVGVTSKKDPKVSKSRVVHFIFDRPWSRYIAVYWASPQNRVYAFSQVATWKQSAHNDGVQVVGNRGIGSPLREVAFELLTGLGGSDDDYEFSASWLLGQPRPIKLDKVTKLIKKEGDHRYKIEAVDVLF